MKNFFLGLALFLSPGLFGQTKQIRTVGDFSGISAASGIKVEITQGSENSVVVSSSKDELVNKIKTEVDKGGLLKIYYEYEKGMWKRAKNLQLNAYVTFKSVEKLMVSSGAQLITMNTVSAANLALTASSGGACTGTVKATDARIDVSSGGVIKLSGSSTNTKIDGSSGGSFKGKDFATENCTADVSSGGDIRITISKTLVANASSGGSILYKGDPIVDKKTSSGGNVGKL